MSSEIRCVKAGHCDLCDKIMEFGHVKSDGKVYCLLHAPHLFTEEQVNSYNSLLEKLITGSAIERRLKIDLIYDIDFSNITFTQPINILYKELKEIKRSLNFFNCVFLEEVTLVGFKFNEVVTFAESRFKKKVLINNSEFHGVDSPNGLKLCVNFDNCIFEDKLWFIGNKVFNTFSFTNVIIEKKSLMMNNIFKKKAKFNGCTFLDYIDFADSIFDDETQFNGSDFHGKTYFALRKDSSRDSMFNKKVDFSFCEFNKAKFASQSKDKTIFSDIALFQDVDVDSKLTFDNVNIEMISFKFSFFDKIYFNNERMPDKLYDEGKITSEEMAEQYRRLKQKYINEGNHSEAGKWHLKEKEFQAKKQNWYSIPIYKLYKWSSGYGENWIESIIVFLSLLLLSIWVIFKFSHLKFDPNGWELFKESFSHTLSILLTNNQDSIKAMGIENNYSAIIFIFIIRIILLIQFWLMSLAMRNHFRR